MRKNSYNIKEYYYKQLVEFFNSLEHIPEQEIRLQKLEVFIKTASTPFKIILAYYFERILSGEETSHYFIDDGLIEDSDALIKINPIQIKYSASVLKRNQEVFNNINTFVYSVSKEVSRFLIAYYVNKNLTGVRVKDIQSLFDKFKLNKYIHTPTLSDFNYDIEYTPKKDKHIPKLKLPVASYNVDGEIFIYYKLGKDIVSDLPEDKLNMFNATLANYKKIAIVGNYTDTTITLYICTAKSKVVEGLHKGNYTLQNSFRYIMDDFNRVKNSFKNWSSILGDIALVQRGNPFIYYDWKSLADAIYYETFPIMLFRNKFVAVKKAKSISYVIKHIDIVKKVLVLTTIGKNGKNDYEVNMKELQIVNDDLQEGNQVTILTINEFKILI